VVPIVRHHHENWDGTGYPDGIAGEDIPIGARILSVVDCFDALTSHRPYRPRMEDAAAFQIIVERRGSMYDPRVVDTFLEIQKTAAPEVPSVAETPALPAAPGQPGPQTTADRELLDLQAFCDLGATLGDATSPEHLGEALWFHLQARIPASTFVLYAYSQTEDALAVIHAAGTAAHLLRGARIPMGERLSGWVAATRQPIVNSDARLDLDEGLRERSTLQSALSVPIEVDVRLAGVLTFYSPQANAFDESHRRLAQAAAYAAARSGVSLHPSTRALKAAPHSLETVQ
jgi:hypothetical protein